MPPKRFLVMAAASIGGALAAASGFAGAPPAGSLDPIPGPGGCVANIDAKPDPTNHTAAEDNCAEGRGLNELHHVALSPDGRFVYTAGGSDTHDPPGDESAIAVFTRDGRTGQVKQLPGAAGCIEHTNPPRDIGCALGRNLQLLRFVTLSSDGRFLYATGSVGLSIFRRDITTGALTQLPGERGCISDKTAGCLQMQGAASVEDLVITRKGVRAYSASSAGYVLLFARDPRTGILRPLGCIGVDNGKAREGCLAGGRGIGRPRSVTLSSDERFAYIASLDGAMGIFARNPRSGMLRQLPGTAGCVAATPAPGCAVARGIKGAHRLTISSDGRFGYLAAKAGGGKAALAVFARNPKTGTVTQLPGTAGCFKEDGTEGCAVGRVIYGAHQLLLTADGRTAYLVGDQFEGGIAVFRRNVSTGVLTQLAGQYGCLSPIVWEGCAIVRRTGGLHFLVLSHDGRFLYAAGEKAQALIVLRVVAPVPFP